MFGFLGKIGGAMKNAAKGGGKKPPTQNNSGFGRLARTGVNMGQSFLGNQSRAKYPTPLGQKPPGSQPGISGPEFGGPPQGIQDAQYRGPGQSRWQHPSLGGGGFTGWGGDGGGNDPGSFDRQWGHPRIIDTPDFLRGDQQMMGQPNLGPSAELRRRFGLG